MAISIRSTKTVTACLVIEVALESLALKRSALLSWEYLLLNLSIIIATSGVPITTSQVPSVNLTRDKIITVASDINPELTCKTYLPLSALRFLAIPRPVKAKPINTASA